MSRYLEPDPERDERARLESDMEVLEFLGVRAQEVRANLDQAAAGIAEVQAIQARNDAQTREANRLLDRMNAALEARETR